MKKILLLLTILIQVHVSGQDFVDIVKLKANQAALDNADNNVETDVSNINLEVYYPKVINDKWIVIAGFTAENTKLNSNSISDSQSLTMARLNLGAKYQHSKKWSGTYVVLPKLASDFENISSNDFQLGAIGILNYQKSERLSYKLGLYASSENHGATITPLLGLWYRSKNEKLYVNAALPVRLDVNYNVVSNFSVGADFLTSIKSYAISESNTNLYVQEESLRFALYASYGFLDNSVLVRAKVGFDSTDYGLYNENDTIGAQILTFQVEGDNRNRLNSEFTTSLFYGVDLIYRFDLKKKE